MRTLLLIPLLCFTTLLVAQKRSKKKLENEPKKEQKAVKHNFNALKFRNVGPAINSGRVIDLAINPNNHSEYYVAVASGGVWKTTNAGVTYRPIFDGQGSYSIGCVTLDPSNPNIVWVGTGENNNQRSVAYGDGVYKSEDGGKSWKNVGLKTSEHIGMIKVHPQNSNVAYVAAYGPLWSEGGERGLYQTIDGGKTWTNILEIDKHTGVSEIHFDPRDPATMYAISHQRRRHVFTYLGGGPGSGIHKSTDGGKTWKKLNGGIPNGDYLGRIGMAISPANPDILYALIEASNGKGGTYKSTDRGASWSKQSGYSTSGNYYQELVPDLTDENKIFSMNTWLHHTEDGGKTWKKTGEKYKHVDNHCMWIDPNNSDHWIVGCDGGIYETWTHAQDWQYKPNLPVTQFYKVAVDNATPFYNIYGGTQDNNSMGGPSRTTNKAGITNSDWFITNGGDGFESQIDPEDPNIVYAQAQYGWLVRYDKRSGQKVGIKPQPGAEEAPYRWNWDAPLLISPHNNKRLYFCANKVFRSDNRGDDWVAISDDLTQQIDRNKLPVMDRVWSADAVMKNKSTSIYGNIVAFDESPLQEGLLYVGTDDGLIQITEDGGKTWRKVTAVGNVPKNTYVNALITSTYDKNTVFAIFNNHKNGDFKPYIYRSNDKGNTWTAIQGDLPERGSVYDIAQDPIDKNLFFAGTEFGVFFTKNSGKNWQQLKGGLPTIAIRDLEIQPRENDLILASFGRGFFVLDDYSPLRNFQEEDTKKVATIYPIKTALVFIESSPLGLRGKSNQGSMFYTADNPPVGTAISYWLGDTTLLTAKENRQKKEKGLIKDKKDLPYPTTAELHQEDWEQKPYLILSISDKDGNVIRRIKTKPSKGLNRIVWDFRHESLIPVQLKDRKAGRYGSLPSGALAAPGKYFAHLTKVHNGKVTKLTEKVPFEIKSLNNATLATADKAALEAFEVKLTKMRRAGRAVGSVYVEMNKRIAHLQKSILQTGEADLKLLEDADKIRLQLKELGVTLYGDNSLSRREFEVNPGLISRMEGTIWSIWYSTAAPSETAQKNYTIAGKLFENFLADLTKVQTEMNQLEQKLNGMGAPYTPGSTAIPDWKME